MVIRTCRRTGTPMFIGRPHWGGILMGGPEEPKKTTGPKSKRSNLSPEEERGRSSRTMQGKERHAMSDLRDRAEERLGEALFAQKDLSLLTRRDIETLVHELNVHQIELEMQKDELRAAQDREEELKNKYLDLYDFAPVGYLTIDESGIITEANLTGSELLGMAKPRVIGKHFHTFVAHTDQDTYYFHRRRLIDDGAIQACEITVLREDGSQFRVSLQSLPLHDPGGQYVGCRTILSDVTEREQAENALRASEEKYRATFNNAAVGIDLVDREGRFLEANETLSEFLGYTREELRNLTIFDVTHPEDAKQTKEAYEALVGGSVATYGLEKRYLRKDGAVVWADTSVSAIRSADGQYRLTVGVIADITNRKKSQELGRRLATAVEQVAETIVITDTKGTILYVNPAFERTTGYSRGEAIGNNPRMLKSGQHDSRFYKHLWETITRGEVWSGHFITRKKDGSLFEEEATISPIKDDQGKIVNYVAVKRDVTKEVSLQRQLLQAQKMEAVGTLAGGIAHDFNNLLQVTLGYSELLLQEKSEADPEYADLLKIFRAAKNGAELVRSLLTFSRRVEPKFIPLSLNRQITEVEKLLRRTIPRMIDIQMNLAGDLSETNADPTQVEQILMNLAINASDAMPNGGSLTISTKNAILDEEYCSSHAGANPGKYVLLTIADTGHGMDEATIQHIFEPFYTTKEIGRGTGLGLAMVYGIVSQHGGQIDCLSELGKGTQFEIYLPAVSAEFEPEAELSEELPAFGTETILLVDDEDLVRELGERILTRNGYTVLTASDGEEGLAVYVREKDHVDLIVLDLIMPTVGGKDCLRKILKINPHAKILVASGYCAGYSTKETLELGARGFVGKPFRSKDLLRQVRKVLDAG
jgi:two-component system, cell cycle sensor histidine kinase and response regulator CckA